jgi:colicin import membrane protein
MNAIQEIKDERNNHLIGYVTTFVIHALLLLWLWISVLHTPDPPLGYGGMELSMALGEADMGGPSDIPVEDPAVTQPVPETPQEEQQVITQDAEETPVTAKPPVEKKPDVTVKKPIEKPIEKPVEKPRVADERALFKKKTTSTAEGGRGDGDIPGNQGNPNGVPDGSPDGNGIGNGLGGSGGGNGRGDGTGDGIGSFDLKGRSLTRRPDITEDSRETGKVVLGITVDRSGKVIKVQPGLKGTTTLNPALIEKAKQGVMNAHFSAKPNGPEEQYGTITVVFRFKQ